MRKLSCGVLVFLTMSAHAQWMSQSIPLIAGWNAVHLKVQPVDDSCDALFAGQPVTVVSWWCRDVSMLGLMPPAPDMRNWYAADPAASTFYRMIGGECYLIKAAEAVTLSIKGTPVLPSASLWLGKPNLVGMNVPLPDNVQMNEYFAFFGSLTNTFPYASVTTSGSTVMRPGTYKPRPGQALWVSTIGNGTAEYTGPFNVSIDSPGGVVAFTTAVPRTLRIRNNANVARTVRIASANSEQPPAGQGGLAGAVALLLSASDWSLGYPREIYQPVTFPWSTNIAANATLELKLLPQISAMPNSADAYQSILAISDQGSADNVPSLTQGRAIYYVGLRAAGDLAQQIQPTGLWVGQAVLDQVNRAKMLSSSIGDWDENLLQDAPHPFGFRVIVHVDGYGIHRLLKEVFVATLSGTTTLLASRDTAVSFRAQNPAAAIRRISSANFPFFGEPQTLQVVSNGFAAAGGMLSCTFTQSYTNRVNPFVHAFHADHDNREIINNGSSLKDNDGSSGKGDYEFWSVARVVKLHFAASDPFGSNPAWNVDVTGGIYEENVLGLNEPGNPILARGAFRLVKIADTPTILYLSAP
ncbi:MAG: hypothetical protein PHO37_03795 [Kiritimatiellae bacterium]|nr:hypothetical protein [Kiritimatiellia bacterium]